MVPSIWANLISSACCVGDREDDDLLLAVEGRLRAGARGGRSGLALGRRGGGGSSVPSDLDALERAP